MILKILSKSNQDKLDLLLNENEKTIKLLLETLKNQNKEEK